MAKAFKYGRPHECKRHCEQDRRTELVITCLVTIIQDSY